jgi:hypothetical protein
MSETKRATPNTALREQIMDPNAPKGEREWWAASTIAHLEAEVERLRDENEALRRARLQVRAHDDPILDVRMFGFSFGFTAAELYDLPRDALVDWVTEKFRDGVRAALPTGGGE